MTLGRIGGRRSQAGLIRRNGSIDPALRHGEAGGRGRLGADKARSPVRLLGTSLMPPREPQVTPPKTCAINSSRDMLEKLKREIVRLAGSIIRQEVVDHGLNAAMTAWHLTDWTWKEIKDSPRLRSLTTRAGTPIREL